MKTIQIYIKSVYGVSRTYVADASQASALQQVTGSRTLETRHIAGLIALGLTFEQVPDPSVKLASWLNPSNVAALKS